MARLRVTCGRYLAINVDRESIRPKDERLIKDPRQKKKHDLRLPSYISSWFDLPVAIHANSIHDLFVLGLSLSRPSEADVYHHNLSSYYDRDLSGVYIKMKYNRPR